MIRSVLDTNTIISALFWSGAPSQIYLSAEERYTLLTSADLLNELEMVLRRPKFESVLKTSGRSVEWYMARHSAYANLVVPAEIPASVVRDPKDRIVLACAVGGQADYIVSGDNDLLILERYENIPIITASQFLERLGKLP